MDHSPQRQRLQNRRLPYPTLSTQSAPTSPTSSSFQNTSGLPSTSSAARNQPSMIQTQPQQQGGLAAPLPSPSSSQPPSYFGHFPPQAPTSNPEPEQQRQNTDSRYVGQRGGSGGAPETAPFLNASNLVAEAAKRAQMACLTRDLGDVGL